MHLLDTRQTRACVSRRGRCRVAPRGARTGATSSQTRPCFLSDSEGSGRKPPMVCCVISQCDAKLDCRRQVPLRTRLKSSGVRSQLQCRAPGSGSRSLCPGRAFTVSHSGAVKGDFAKLCSAVAGCGTSTRTIRDCTYSVVASMLTSGQAGESKCRKTWTSTTGHERSALDTSSNLR